MIKRNYTKLYKRATNRTGKLGKIQEWACWIEETPEGAWICRESGQKDGKQNIKKKLVKSGKNIGKSNETTPLQQALFELNNMVQSKIEDNCVLSEADVDLPPRYLYPALAVPHDLKKTKALLKKRGYVFIQPKLNGARAWNIRHLKDDGWLTNPLETMISRKIKVFGCIDHIAKEVPVFGGYTPDGEIFNPLMDFQTIISLLKKYYALGEHPDYPEYCTEDLQYHVYDLAIPGLMYKERKEILDAVIAGYQHQNPAAIKVIKAVETIRATSIEEIDYHQARWVNLGYEGLIVRDPDSEYAFNDRNESLIKYKKFYDDEFEIIGHEIEIWDDVLTGEHRDLVKWVCQTKDGKVFVSRPKGSYAQRERICKEAPLYYGKMLTVRYQELSQEGTPIMNIGQKIVEGEIIRDYE